MYNGNGTANRERIYDLPKYDKDGNLVRLVDGNGRVYLVRSYDREGRLLSYVENRNIRPATYTYTYETRADGAIYPDARLVGVTCTDGVFCRHSETAYDVLGRVLGRTATVGNGSSAFSLGESIG